MLGIPWWAIALFVGTALLTGVILAVVITRRVWSNDGPEGDRPKTDGEQTLEILDREIKRDE
jgi:hypothetical protein